MFKHKSFDPKVIIVDHFDDVKNQIDIRSETIFHEKNHILSEKRKQFLNKVRQTFLEKIDQVKEKNLSKFASINDVEAFKTKWSHVIESDLLEYEKTIESLKDDMIMLDCIVISDEKCALGVVLWITPWYFNEKSLDILRIFNRFSDDSPFSDIKIRHYSLDKVAVIIFCLISDKQKHAGDIKDFSQLNLSKIEKLTLPWVSSNSYKGHDILEIGSIDKNAFVEFTNLTCLHLHIRLKLQPHTYDKVDFKHLINLKELCLERTPDREFNLNHTPNYLNLSPPPNLEKLTIVYFDIKLNTLTHLKNLNFLRLDKVQTLGLSDSYAILDFASLKHFDFGFRKLVFDCINSSSLHMGPKSLEVLKMGDIRCINGQQPNIFFENLPNLKKLKVVVNSLDKIDLVSLKELSSLEDLSLVLSVECSNEKKLIGLLGNFSRLKKLSVYGLSSVNRDFFKQFQNLESLNLWVESNDIQSGSFDSLTNLTVLNLSYNQFEQIDVDLFKSLTKLVSLDLSFNALKRIPSKFFANFAALNELNLGKCKLLDLEPKTFHGLVNLNALTLKSNNLTLLNEASFKGLKNLTQLDLSFNNLTEINEETFCDTCNLSKLDLSYNQLIDIRFDESLHQFKCLNLSRNKLEKFEINLRNLEELNLSSNETLKGLRPGAFKNLSNLKRLYLDQCSLKVVDANTFEGLSSLEHLNLAENRIEDIEMGTFDSMENLKMLDIRGNGKKFYEKLVSNEQPPFNNSLREINPGCVILYEQILDQELSSKFT